MNSKKCLKCGHVAQFNGEPPVSCEECGAVYSKVEQALREGPPTRPAGAAPIRAQSARRIDEDHHAYAHQLRQESIYPTFRAVVGIAYWIGVVLAALILLGAIVAAFKVGPAPAIGGLVGSIFIFIVARVSKEMSLMLADMSDATIKMAARQDRS